MTVSDLTVHIPTSDLTVHILLSDFTVHIPASDRSLEIERKSNACLMDRLRVEEGIIINPCPTNDVTSLKQPPSNELSWLQEVISAVWTQLVEITSIETEANHFINDE